MFSFLSYSPDYMANVNIKKWSNLCTCSHKNLDRIELLQEVLQEIIEWNFDLPRRDWTRGSTLRSAWSERIRDRERQTNRKWEKYLELQREGGAAV